MYNSIFLVQYYNIAYDFNKTQSSTVWILTINFMGCYEKIGSGKNAKNIYDVTYNQDP